MKQLLWLGVLLLAGCAGDTTPVPTATPTLGEVSIQVPSEGTVYYGEVIRIAGTSRSVPADGFDVALLVAGEPVGRVRVIAVDDAWSVAIPFQSAEPLLLTIRAESIDQTITYDEVVAPVGVRSDRPEGVYGLLTTPSENEVVGGEMILVSGVVSGGVDEPVSIVLTDDRSNELRRVQVLLSGLSSLDEIPFTADVPVAGLTGPVFITLMVGDTEIDRVGIMLGMIAG